jgi:uncharacterized damage-inducible protein DinB
MSAFVFHMRKSARNNAWSNHRLYAACAALGPGEFTAPRLSFFPSISATLNHLLAVDHYYLDAVTGGGRGPRAFHEFVATQDAAALAEGQKASDAVLIRYCDRLTDEALAGTVMTDRGEAGVHREVVADLLAHLFLHQIHHRGQVHGMLSGTSIKPPQLDEYFLAFDHETRAAGLIETGIKGPEDLS